jgi:hypothetical protein
MGCASVLYFKHNLMLYVSTEDGNKMLKLVALQQ